MLLSQEQIQTLKQVNISRDGVKTKERVETDFKTASKADKAAIVELTGQKVTAVYRVFKTGAVNARIAVAMAQTLNVNPWYYTGESDDKEPIDDIQFRQFLKVKGYNKLQLSLQEPKAKRPYNKKPKPEALAAEEAPAPAEAATEEPPVPAAKKTRAKKDKAPFNSRGIAFDTEAPKGSMKKNDSSEVRSWTDSEDAHEVILLLSNTPEMKKAVDDLSEDDAKELLHTLFIRAKGGGEAKFFADVVKRCLLK